MSEIGQSTIVNLSYCSSHIIDNLPDTMKIAGELYFFSNVIPSIPNRLYVKGPLSLVDCNVKYELKNLIVGGDLHIQQAFIKNISENIIIGGLILYDKNTSFFDKGSIIARLQSVYGSRLVHDMRYSY